VNATSPRRAVAERMAQDAAAFLACLDGAQVHVAHWPFPADEERRLWFYTPTDHGGLALAEMSSAQHRLAHRLLASGLSRAGYVTAATVMGLENVLDHLEGWSAGFERERGRDPLLYYVRVFGQPGDDQWGWRFGGHHVSISHTIVGGEVVSSTPCFLGADPARSPLLGPHPLRPLEGVEEVARDLVQSLDPSQRSSAVISPVAPTDLVGANRTLLSDGDVPLGLPEIWRRRFEGPLGAALERVQHQAEETLGIGPEHVDAVRLTTSPKGVAATDLRADQRDRLSALLRLYLDRLPDELAEDEAAKLVPERFDRLHFAWAGETAAGQPHYYRIQGPRLLVEYDNTQRDVNHVHSVWRDPEGDFGADVLGQHYLSHHGAS
jgi:Protein of unknown function (DUF3500)